MSADGYIKLHRSIRKNFLWKDKPFTKGQAWIDLLMDARFDDGGYFKRNIWIPLSRGQVGKSELTLADSWGWSRGKVRRFLETLKNESMVTLKQDNKTTVITICEYETYQGRENVNDTPNSTADGTPNGHQTDTKRYTKKKEKNGNKEKNEKIKMVIDYLNRKLGTDFKHTASKTVACISARLSEGYTGEDFKTVINKKISEWSGTDQAKYLRPETLFGSKFDGYLNQIDIKPQQDDGSARAKRLEQQAREYIES